MKILTRSLFITVAMLLVLNATGQLFGPKFRSYVYLGPEKQLTTVQRIAILNFQNLGPYYAKQAEIDFGTKLADYLTANLIEEYRGADIEKLYLSGGITNIYQVIERSRLNSVLREQNLQASSLVDDNTAIQLGKILGVDAIITGSLSFEVSDTRKTSESTNKKTNEKTVTHYLTRNVITEARMKIIDVQTAEVLGTLTPKHTLTDEKYSTKGSVPTSAVQSVNQMADEAFRIVSSQLADYFAPSYQYFTFNIKKLKLDKYKDRAKDAENYLKNGEIENAYKIYNAIHDEDSYNPEVAYNLGILYEVTGDFDKANELYSKAYMLDDSDRDFQDAYNRGKRSLALKQYLDNMGIPIHKYEFADGSSTVLAAKVITKGNRSDRIPVYEEAKTNSTVVAQIPGDIELSVINQVNSWFLVELFDGNQVYIQASDVKSE